MMNLMNWGTWKRPTTSQNTVLTIDHTSVSRQKGYEYIFLQHGHIDEIIFINVQSLARPGSFDEMFKIEVYFPNRSKPRY